MLGSQWLGRAWLLASGEGGFFHRLWLRRDAGTAEGAMTDTVFMWLWWFCVAWFVFLMALMVYFVVKYRRRPGVPAPHSSSHNPSLEIAWTIIPTLCLVVMFFAGFWGYIGKLVAPGHAVEMRVDGWKWNWSLTYPNGLTAPQVTKMGSRGDVPVFYAPAGVPVRLVMKSNDVMHAFWVPDFRIKQDVLPNRLMSVWFEAKSPDGTRKLQGSDPDAPGFLDSEAQLDGTPFEDHWVFCAEYCGEQHSEMAAVLRVLPADAFSRWQDWATAKSSNLNPCELGARVYKSKCASCHSVDGSANTGPTWKNIFGREHAFTDGSKLSAEDMGDPVKFANYVRESVLVPSAKIVAGFTNQMNSFQGQITEKELDGVVAYMKTLSENYQGPDPCGETPGDSAAGEAKNPAN